MFQYVTMDADITPDFTYWLRRYEGVARVSRTALESSAREFDRARDASRTFFAMRKCMGIEL
ncbi:hypothetical protein CBM2589_B120205 [Cupriavidus taiwanensis]|uniref:Uncharacterized protein n=1 Tax=Cupriavidus taiwanensis TaxID=164546 RepID=A0A975WU34_9BURK|nr:hypothetical protein CBM2589_B120205 [Cupriavidus taiwanensis]